MKIMTWNINSVRLRAGLVNDVMDELQPDVVCLQETKTVDDLFPFAAFEENGYDFIHVNGMKSYNGVAILSKYPFAAENIHSRFGKEDCRHISVTFTPEQLQKTGFKNAQEGKSLTIHNLYIPAGGDEPDPVINEKFAHKLGFIDELTEWFPQQHKKDDYVVALGDFNIAPMEHDVWSHKQLLKVVSHTPIEVEKLSAMQNSLGWVDAVRHFVPEEEKCYSWWSYRNRDYKKSNRGRRLDHIWCTEPLQGKLASHFVHVDARSVEKPSDHVPVMIELA